MAAKKTIAAVSCVAVSAAAIVGGVWARSSSAPLALPVSADDAIAGLKSDAYARMDDQRRRQYAFEAGKLLRELTPEEREQLREDEDLREALRLARDDMFEEMVRRAARGDGMEMPQWGQRPRGERPELTDEQRAEMEQRREQMRERIAQQLQDSWNSGDAQSSGLRQEFFKNRGRGGGGNGGGGRRGG